MRLPRLRSQVSSLTQWNRSPRKTAIAEEVAEAAARLIWARRFVSSRRRPGALIQGPCRERTRQDGRGAQGTIPDAGFFRMAFCIGWIGMIASWLNWPKKPIVTLEDHVTCASCGLNRENSVRGSGSGSRWRSRSALGSRGWDSLVVNSSGNFAGLTKAASCVRAPRPSALVQKPRTSTVNPPRDLPRESPPPTTPWKSPERSRRISRARRESPFLRLFVVWSFFGVIPCAACGEEKREPKAKTLSLHKAPPAYVRNAKDDSKWPGIIRDGIDAARKYFGNYGPVSCGIG